MFGNYLTSAVRALNRDRFHAALNIFGLAVSLAAALLIALFVRHENSYENFFTEPERVYRVESRASFNPEPLGGTPLAALDLMTSDFGGQMTIAPILSSPIGRDGLAVVVNGNPSTEHALITDERLFHVLDFPVLHGDGVAALKRPGHVVLTKTAALRLFGVENAVGRKMRVEDAHEVTVGAVIEDLPNNTDFSFGMMVQIEAPFIRDPMPHYVRTNWTWLSLQTFVRLHEGVTADAINAQFPDFVRRYVPKEQTVAGEPAFYLAPINGIHLRGGADQTVIHDRNRVFMTALAGTGVLLVLIACFNYVNLATARSLLRVKEVGLRKILGGSSRQLVAQFMGEALVMTMASFLVALALAASFLPIFNALVNRDMGLADLFSTGFLAVAVGVALLTGLAAGTYPALVLAASHPTALFQNQKSSSGGHSLLRGVLVGVQFSLSVGLIITATVVYSQIRYLKTIDPGFEKRGLIGITGPFDPREAGRIETFRTELARNPHFSAAALSNSFPDLQYDMGLYLKRRDDNPQDGTDILQAIYVGDDYFTVMGLPLLAGRGLSSHRPGDGMARPRAEDNLVLASIVLTEPVLPMLGFQAPKDAIGQELTFARRPDYENIIYTVVGVVPDTKFNLGLREDRPAVYVSVPGQMYVILARLAGGDPQVALAEARTIWRDIFPNLPFDYRFIEDVIAEDTADQDRQSRLFTLFTGLAIIVACLGLFGLASFAAVRRTHEIAVRKVLGASTADVTWLLLWDFAKPVLLANIVAWPIAWILMREWLNGFAYRVDLSPAFFIGASLLALGIALMTVMIRTVRAARIRPAMALKYE